MRAETEVRCRGWTVAESPADADVLLVCGVPGAELSSVCDRVWEQLPGPRVRVEAQHEEATSAALDKAVTMILDSAAQRRDAVSRKQKASEGEGEKTADPASSHMDHRVSASAADTPSATGEGPQHDGMRPSPTGHEDDGTDGRQPDEAHAEAGSHTDMDHADMGHGDTDHSAMGHGDMDHGDTDHSAMGHSGMDHGDTDHSAMGHSGMNHADMGHGDMGHGGMEMMMPGGIGLAEGGPDRDGLNLDVLNVPLGPVLPHWPSGLVIRCALQGDVVTEAAVEILPAGGSPPEAAVTGGGDDAARRDGILRRCDGIGRLLAVAGWSRAATMAFGVRDRLLDGASVQEAAGQLSRLRRRVRRSRVLRWSLKEPDGVLEALYRSLDEACRAAEAEEQGGHAVGGTLHGQVQVHAHDLVGRLVGLDVAAARLVVAASVLNAAPVLVERTDHG
ncbi:hypothetical protein SAMN04488693_13215 [Arthrobacter subterraneus]|uniref:Uncharacterized protein n=2 Tax=Arthrobacter subterraneus TaxID=335973 RepID=A0A1G8PDE2_9MICC|nr:hypothetical protein SAMN04488693_13215 [Arthrobacter subterraneus]